MPVLMLHDLCKAFGHQVLLNHVDLRVTAGARVGLIGRNGEGKSTLLKVIAGLMDVDSGKVQLKNKAKVAYLQQDPYYEAGQTVFQVVSHGLGDIAKTLEAYHEATMALETDHSDAALKKLDDLQHQLDHADAWKFHARIETAITKLNLDADRDVGELSGGWLRRVALAQAVVIEPDVLLLDEPTNHLDISSIEWLEDFVASFPGAVLFITHDRYFLDAVAEEIIELDRGKLTHFQASYAEYLTKKAELLEIEGREFKKFDKMLANEEKWIRQGIPARRTRNEGRVRALEELRKQRSARKLRGGDVDLRVASGVKPGKQLLELIDVSHAFEKTVITDNFSQKILSGERIGFLGPNGIGKTTLLNIMLGKLTPDSGIVKHGVRLAPAFLTQMRELDAKAKLKDILVPDGGNFVHIGGIEPRHIVSYMQDFLFDSELLNAPVSSLSGGERGRLLLAKMLLEPANLLVLDEPTNDLDIGTLAVLEEAIAKYKGTVIVVSHDRAFMDRVVSKVFAFEGNGQINAIEGGYSDYLAWKEGAELREKAKKTAEKEKTTEVKQEKTVKNIKKLAYKDQKELDDLPALIENTETEKSDIEARFCDADYFTNEPDKFQNDQKRLDILNKTLENAYTRWEELEAKQESF
ncbi:MAG: ATP-binding cassette domain-containing protein [Ghiorsea sp.]